MPVKWELRENGRVIYVRVTNPLTADEIVATAKEQRFCYDTVADTLHQVVNVTGVRMLPNHILSIVQGVPAMKHPKHGQMVIVGANGFLRAIASMMDRLIHSSQIKVVATETEAWDYLHEVLKQEPTQVRTG